MTEVNSMVLGLNTLEKMPAYVDCENGGKIPVQHGSGEILLIVDAVPSGTLTVSAGNTVFGGKEASFEIPEGTRSVIRLEVGPHLKAGKEGNYIEIYSPYNSSVAVIELK